MNPGGWLQLRDRILATIPSANNRTPVLKYLAERQAAGIKVGTLACDANALRGLCVFLGKRSVEDVTRDDLVAYLNDAERERTWRSKRNDGAETVTRRRVGLSPSTLAIRRIVIRQFYRWLRQTADDPPETRNLKARRITKDTFPTDRIIGRPELERLLAAHRDPQAKAILAVLFDGGFRAGEFCALNTGSLVFDEYGAVLTLPKGGQGLKTGARRVRLFEAVPYLHAWFETHPRKTDPKAPLFFSNSHRAPGARLTNGALWNFVNHAGKRADLAFHIHPHALRHSCATEKARLGWTESQMRSYFGWSRSSNMPTHYVHLAGGDYEDMELERRGLLQDAKRRRPALAGVLCRVCKHNNSMNTLFCVKCRNPVSPEAEAKLQQSRRSELEEVVQSLMFKAAQQLGTNPILAVDKYHPVDATAGQIETGR